MRIKSADLKNEVCSIEFCGSSCFLDEGKAVDCHMMVRMIGEIKVSRDRFRYVFVIFPHVTKVFSESVA